MSAQSYLYYTSNPAALKEKSVINNRARSSKYQESSNHLCGAQSSCDFFRYFSLYYNLSVQHHAIPLYILLTKVIFPLIDKKSFQLIIQEGNCNQTVLQNLIKLCCIRAPNSGGAYARHFMIISSAWLQC